jgi:ANTAR domain
MSNGREAHVIDKFLALTDTLVSDFDALDMLMMLAERTVGLLDVSAAGIVLTDGTAGLSVATASSERTRLLEVFAVDIDGGPCVDCVRSGAANRPAHPRRPGRQAKGRVAYHAEIPPDDAFEVLRRYARSNGLRLTELCRDVVEDRIALPAVIGPAADGPAGDAVI